MLSYTIAPARDVGVMAHGRLIGRVLTYEIGAFRNDGENAELDEGFLLPGEEWHNEHGAAARVTVQPFRRLKGAGAFERLQLGVAYTTSHVPEGLNSLKGETPLDFVFFEPVYTYGRRWRLGLEAVWMPGPFSIKSEYARSDEARIRQGLGDVDLSGFIASGWYVSATWALTGESKEDGIEPRRPIFQGGPGALELAVRYEELGFGSELTEGEAYSNPRADPVLPNRDHLWTIGVNWYLNKWSKIQLNGTRETFQDPERSPIPNQPVWSGVCRLQFVM
jgi:phosphate-selective porin OprO/OprP